MDELPIGRRVAYWRSRRKMSQQVFADRLGKSKSWVDKIERGVRRLDKFSVLYEIADVLQLDAQLLLGKAPARRTDALSCIDEVEVEAIRSALERYDSMTSFFVASPEPPSLAEVAKSVSHAWLTYQYARYGVLTRALPKLLRDAQALDSTASGDDAPRAAHLLGQVYQIASSALRKLGEYELAWLAADRSMAVAQRAEDPLLAGVATYRVGNALLALGRARAALEVNVSFANRIAPGGSNDASDERLSVYGMLLLQGAMAAARMGDNTTVRDLVNGAAEAAERLGRDDNCYWTCFGPTNLELHRAAAAVELGEGRYAVETHERRILGREGFNALLPERRAHHMLDLARGFAQIGALDKAGEALVEGDRLAPSEIRCRPIAHEVMSNVLRRTRGAPPAPIAELAEHMGVGV
ncbi:helix-turn-helix domain-containing protein [Micromonospora sp. HM5-17]|uniref:helix-turn-helix domain-containing protein n=1 Tax=Micromonospora sp. HM5-17 TaxID=2487710 RepID=UPI000F496E50|nr:helix-turn-helix domain-containing protein [Micromonospora sp. HM5-17]ROT31398.1 XRE family transcriptional regulator [Micromonospora sp. HM5-17]